MTENPYEAPGASIEPPVAASQPRSWVRWPLGFIAMVAWVVPWGVAVTGSVVVLAWYSVLVGKDRRAIGAAVLGGIGLSLYTVVAVLDIFFDVHLHNSYFTFGEDIRVGH